MEPDSTPAPFLFGRGVARGAAIRAKVMALLDAAEAANQAQAAELLGPDKKRKSA
jgi:hypothetical protein